MFYCCEEIEALTETMTTLKKENIRLGLPYNSDVSSIIIMEGSMAAHRLDARRRRVLHLNQQTAGRESDIGPGLNI